MSEHNGTVSTAGPGTTPIVLGEGAAAAPARDVEATAVTPAPGAPAPEPPSEPAPTVEPGVQPTAPVTVRPKPRMPRRGPLTVMGPWAPVAGGLLGILLGVVVVLFLAGVAESFEDRLALTFTVLGLGMLGTSGTLLADEVRMIRQQAREAAVRPQWVEATAGLLNGLTPARLLLGASALVLFLAAYVSRG